MTPKQTFVILGALLIGLAGTAWAQRVVDDPDWKEIEVPPPPAFDASKLIKFEVSPNASLVYGVDPAALRISRSDGVVRYVMVATSASGATNVMYEGIRCATGEFKTYHATHPMVSGERLPILSGARFLVAPRQGMHCNLPRPAAAKTLRPHLQWLKS